MPTPNLSDEELDALFRRTTAAYPPADASEGWHHMEPRLNGLMRYQRAIRQVVRWFVAEVGLIAVLLSGWFMYAPHLSAPPARSAAPAVGRLRQPLASASRFPQASPHVSRSSTQEKSTSPTTKAQPQLALKSTAQLPQTVVAAPRAKAAPHNLSAPAKGFLMLEAAPRKRAKLGQVSTEKSNTAPSIAASRTLLSSGRHRSSSGSSAIDASEVPVAGSAVTVPPATPDPPTTDSTAAPAPPAVAATTPEDTTSHSKSPRRKPVYRLGLALQYAPEVSAVRMSEIEKTGRDVGVQLEYFFTPRLSLNTGLLHAVKRYETRGSDYHVTYGKVPLDRVYAVCGMLDIPLNLRYALLYRPTYQVFASAGLSSLLMRDEQYELWYTYANQPVRRTRQVVNGSNHPLSVLNLSAGYERQVQARWGVRAEPFVKVPLGGVGYGKVKLSSAGVFFSVQYRLLPSALQMN
ncbi:hypothetical protein [Hymenobacter sp. DG25A]|uniref:hypothetical protein n=1 Tax=Hymenobacter sp. DG25A TaxID=1385663 RepID=UPI000ADC98D9|nr:hypothetical protein [Hymenobacter sp. DG25A]